MKSEYSDSGVDHGVERIYRGRQRIKIENPPFNFDPQLNAPGSHLCAYSHGDPIFFFSRAARKIHFHYRHLRAIISESLNNLRCPKMRVLVATTHVVPLTTGIASGSVTKWRAHLCSVLIKRMRLWTSNVLAVLV